jgi:hypothetical protein
MRPFGTHLIPLLMHRRPCATHGQDGGGKSPMKKL